ncbi:MAG: SPOR domain-containing protein [Sphingopyxis sp.]
MAGENGAGQGNDGLGLAEEDRLPWLEAADGFDEEGDVSPARLLIMMLGGLLLIGAVLGGLWWVQNGGARGKGELIVAEKGDYKVAPKTDGAKTFEGEGDASFSASEGAAPAGKVDPSRMPEEPAVTAAEREAPAAAAKADTRASAKPGTAPEPAPPSGAMIQLGAFSSEGAAAKAWTNLSKRFAYLAELNRVISPAKVGSGTVYRLRVPAGTAANAADLCGKLRVAGENCVIVR